MDIKERILQALPYGQDFRFVDDIDQIDESTIQGHYTFTPSSPWYRSHFSDMPLVPGVLMIECMGQIGMVCHLAFLSNRPEFDFWPVLSNVESSFHDMAAYGEKCLVTGKKIYFRKNILKSAVEMRKADGKLIAVLTANIMIKDKDA